MNAGYFIVIVLVSGFVAGTIHGAVNLAIVEPYLDEAIEIEKLYFRNNPIYHDILSGYSEARLLMSMPIEAKLNGIMKKRFPQTRQVILTSGGAN